MEPPDKDRARESRREPRDEVEALPFSVQIVDRVAGQRVLARAATASLARAIFTAAQTEYPHGRVLLKRGGETVLDSAS